MIIHALDSGVWIVEGMQLFYSLLVLYLSDVRSGGKDQMLFNSVIIPLSLSRNKEF